MNQLFNSRRFWLLLKLHIAENGRNYLTCSAVLIALMLLLMSTVLMGRRYNDLLELSHPLALFMCVLFGGSLITSFAFLPYSNPVKGIPALMVPASRLEKFLVAWLFYILFTVAFMLIFLYLHPIIFDLANRHLPVSDRHYRPIPAEAALFIGYLFFLLQGSVFLGSVYFSKVAYVKSVIVLIALGLTASLLSDRLANTFTSFPVNMVALPFTSWRINWRYVIEYPEPVQIMVWVFLVLVVVSLWGIAYVRLKEKEI